MAAHGVFAEVIGRAEARGEAIENGLLARAIDIAGLVGDGPAADGLSVKAEAAAAAADALEAGSLLRRTGRRKWMRGEPEAALQDFEQAVSCFEHAGAERERAIARGDMADILVQKGETEEALRIRREEELPVYERLGDVRSYAVTMGKIADILVQKGETEEALRIRREEELPVYERLADVRERSVTLFKIARALIGTGGLQSGGAQEIFEALSESFSIAARLGLADGVASVGVPLGQVLAAAGQKQEAATVLDMAAAASDRLGQTEDAAAIRQLIAELGEAP